MNNIIPANLFGSLKLSLRLVADKKSGAVDHWGILLERICQKLSGLVDIFSYLWNVIHYSRGIGGLLVYLETIVTLWCEVFFKPVALRLAKSSDMHELFDEVREHARKLLEKHIKKPFFDAGIPTYDS
ncbi:hypothetical protein CK203_077584 [Vitis vinifera]|uniref:Uncharacterized protein n=1 Tax=Vitis vinifera TaxID=29760 RepID=A0A438ETX1_VITVI|nr:hypothetical protein CK203_077584 [Vitis vinifera]